MTGATERPKILRVCLGPTTIGGSNEIEVSLVGDLSYTLFGTPEEAEAVAANAGLRPVPGRSGEWR